MAQKLNSERKHYIAPWTDDETKPDEAGYLWLASGITTMGNDTEDKTEDYNDYTGIDTTDITGVQVKWTPEGYVDFEDEAQALVNTKRYANRRQAAKSNKWVDDGTAKSCPFARCQNLRWRFQYQRRNFFYNSTRPGA